MTRSQGPKFANVRLQAQDSRMDGLQLLYFIRRKIDTFQYTLDPFPLMSKHTLCLSIAVPGDRSSYHGMAMVTLDRWIEHYSSDGLPFNRRLVFPADGENCGD